MDGQWGGAPLTPAQNRAEALTFKRAISSHPSSQSVIDGCVTSSPASWHETTTISLGAWVLWVRNLDRAQSGVGGRLHSVGNICWGLESSGGILTQVWCLGWADSKAGLSWAPSVSRAGGWIPRVAVPREHPEGWQCWRPRSSCLPFKAQPWLRLTLW